MLFYKRKAKDSQKYLIEVLISINNLFHKDELYNIKKVQKNIFK